jgi:hypothetical protein
MPKKVTRRIPRITILQNRARKEASIMGIRLRDRLPLSIYAGLGFSWIAFIVTRINPTIYDKIQQARAMYENAVPPQIPPMELMYMGPLRTHYPWGYYSCLLGIGVAVLMLFVPRVLGLFRADGNPYLRFTSAFIILGLFGAISLANFGFDPGYFVWILLLGFIVGIIDGVRSSKIDLSFLDSQDILLSVKLQKLRSEYDKWWRGLTIFTGVLIAASISGALQSVAANPALVRNEASIVFFSILAFMGIGLGVGLYWEVIRRVNHITEKILTVK